MADLERVYNVPLRKEFRKAPKYKRTMKAVKALREFLKKHMKCEIVKIGKYTNLELHKGGRKHPPHHIKIKAIKKTEKIKGKDTEVVRAELVGAPVEKPFLKESLGKETKKEEIKGETIVAEEKDEEKITEKEKVDQEKEKVLEKEVEKKEEIKSKIKIKDKEKSIKSKKDQIIAKTEKPIHEGKR